jgi:GNAT superfamily N-acetyltransferase
MQSLKYIINYNPEKHRENYKKFIIESYGRNDHILLSEKFLKWQFFDNPFNNTGNYTIKLFVKENFILGQIGYIPIKLSLSTGEVVNACYPVNLIVRPEFRSLGIGVILLKNLINEHRFLINPGASAEGEKLCIGLNMKSLGFLRRYVCIISPDKIKSFYSGNPEDLNKIEKIVISDKSSSINNDFLNLPNDDIFRIFGVKYFPFHVVRNLDFLKWRYLTHPFFKYHFLYDNEKKCMMIYREEIELLTNTKIWRIVELITTIENCKEMLKKLITDAVSNNVAFIDFICSSDIYEPAFTEAGFLNDSSKIVQKIAYLFQPLDFRKIGIRLIISPLGGPSFNINNWYVTKGDSDQDRPNVLQN